jgi:hypothetical protein
VLNWLLMLGWALLTGRTTRWLRMVTGRLRIATLLARAR